MEEKISIPNWLKEIYKQVFIDYEKSILSLLKPPKRYYLRVNITKAKPKNVIEKLEKENIYAKQDETLNDAIFIEGYKENIPRFLDKYVIAKLDAAESVAQGADLYKAGVLSIKYARKNDLISIITQKNIVAAEGLLVINPKEITKITKGIVVKNVKPKFKLPSIRSLKTFNEKLIYPQSYPSILTVHELEPKENETILDMCSSPGGKLSHIISLTRNRAKIIAIDKSNLKIQRIKETLRNLDLQEPILIKGDARYLDKILGTEFADKILLDPSCSNLGLRPRLTLDIPIKDPNIYSKYQKALIKSAYNCLKKNGILIYSVCTISKEETLNIFNYAKEELKMQPLELKYKFSGNKYINIFDPFKHDTTGYAIFKLIKI